MPAISRTWWSTHSMPAAWSPLRRAVAPAGDRRLEELRPLRIIFPQGRLQRVHTFSSRRFRRRPCLIRNDREVVAEQVAVVPVEVAVAVVPVVAAREAVEQVVAVEEARAEVRAAAAKVAREEALVEEGVGLVEAPAAVPVVLRPISTIRLTTSRGQSCRRSHFRPRPTNRSWQRSQTERAVS